MEQQAVTQGRIVRYVDPAGEEWPAIVVRVHGNAVQAVDLFVFRNSPACCTPMSVPYRENRGGSVDSWHWPPR